MSAKSKIVVKQHWILLSKKFFFILPKPFCFGWLGFVCQITAVIAHCRISELQIRQKNVIFRFFGIFFGLNLSKLNSRNIQTIFIPENGSGFPASVRSRDQSFHQFDCFALKRFLTDYFGRDAFPSFRL